MDNYMGRKLQPGKCVYCLKEHEELTSDHVFPKAWYPDSTPENEYKWQVPSCLSCNRKYGVLEHDLLIRIGLCLDRSDPRCAGIVEKAMRAIDPAYGENQRDRRARHAKKQQILREMIKGEDIPADGIYPNFGPYSNIPIQQQGAVPISAASVEQIAEKIVRGIFYLEDNQFIEPPYEIKFLALTDEGAAPFVEAVNKFGTVHAREPGIVVRRAVAPEDQASSVFAVEIWGRFKMYAFVRRGDS